MSSNNQYPNNDEQYYDDEIEKQEEKKKKISKTKFFKRTLVGTLACGGIALVIFNSCQKSESEDNKIQKPKPNTKKENIEETKVIGGTEEITSATVKEDGTVTLNSDDDMDDNSINNETSNPTETIEETTEASISDTEVEQIPQVNRTVVTAEDVKVVVNNYYTYLNARVEDPANMVDVGPVYSLAFMANCQYINVEECNKLINEGLIPSDLTTIKTEVDNNMSVIISEDVSKVSVSNFFGTELDKNNLFDLSELFIDDTDKEVAKHAYNEYCKLISTTNTYDENGNLVLSASTNACNIYENTRNFFNNCTKNDFEDIGYDARHFTHNYPVNFTQTSVGAQYIIKGIIGPEFAVYMGSNGYANERELTEFQKTIDDVEGPISYLDDKYNGICFNSETVKTYVK